MAIRERSVFSIAENPNRCPGLMPTPPLHSRLTSDGVASTCRMHRVNQALTTFQIPYASQFLVPYQHGFVSKVLSLTCLLNAPCRAFRVDLFGKHQDKKRTRPEAIS
jgi:hypothetical protein